MSLSVCMLTADPAPQVAAILSELRELADEVVVAADHRVPPEELEGYATVADVVLRMEYRQLERHLGWLYAQCSGDWILRLDGDELPSASLLRRLPELLASRRIAQYCMPQAWCHPDPRHVLDEPPWSADFINRLVRNTGDGLRFGGAQHLHTVPCTPISYEPDPLYHLTLLLTGPAERKAKAITYEVLRPHVVAPGGGRVNEAYYLPELREHPPALRAVPAEDVARIERVLAAAHEAVTAGPAAHLRQRVVRLPESDRFWPGRTAGPGARRARIEAYGSRHRALPGEATTLFVRVTNDGSERWSHVLDEPPLIRLSYHLERPDGTVVAEGPRSAMARPVAPGERILTPVLVHAPAEPGEHVVAVDLVHEDVAWFGATCRIPLHVAARSDLPPLGPRLAPTGLPRLRALRRRRIPRLIHRAWLGTAPQPATAIAWGEAFAALHPRWTVRLWTDDDLDGLGIGERERAAARSPSELSNLLRYEVLARQGGVWVDTDVEPRRRLDPLLRGSRVVAGLELPGRVGTAVLAAAPGQPVFVRAAAEARRTLGLGACSPDATGPYFVSLLLEQEPGATILEHTHFYPYSWTEPERRHEAFESAYCVHHWTLSWLDAQ